MCLDHAAVWYDDVNEKGANFSRARVFFLCFCSENGYVRLVDFMADPLHISFHDEEWGVPARDDKKLFELLVLAEAFGELSWPTILHNRDTFRFLLLNLYNNSAVSVGRLERA